MSKHVLALCLILSGLGHADVARYEPDVPISDPETNQNFVDDAYLDASRLRSNERARQIGEALHDNVFMPEAFGRSFVQIASREAARPVRPTLNASRIANSHVLKAVIVAGHLLEVGTSDSFIAQAEYLAKVNADPAGMLDSFRRLSWRRRDASTPAASVQLIVRESNGYFGLTDAFARASGRRAVEIPFAYDGVGAPEIQDLVTSVLRAIYENRDPILVVDEWQRWSFEEQVAWATLFEHREILGSASVVLVEGAWDALPKQTTAVQATWGRVTDVDAIHYLYAPVTPTEFAEVIGRFKIPRLGPQSRWAERIGLEASEWQALDPHPILRAVGRILRSRGQGCEHLLLAKPYDALASKHRLVNVVREFFEVRDR